MTYETINAETTANGITSNSKSKTTKRTGRLARIAVLASVAFGLSLSLAAASTSWAKEGEIKFTNSTAVKATDLHVKFKRGSLKVVSISPVNSLPVNDAADTRSTVNFKAGLGGDGVPAGGSMIVKFEYSGSDPIVEEAKWTNGNTLKPEKGDFIPGGTLGSTDITYGFDTSMSATGDGFYMVFIDHQAYDFVTFPGENGEQAAARLAQLVDDTEWGQVLAQEGAMGQITSYSLYPNEPNIFIEILQQDSTMPLILDECHMQLQVDNLVAGQKAQFTINDHHEGMVVAIVYSLKEGYTGVNNVFGYCGGLGLKGVSPDSLIGQGPIVGGQYTKMLPIPPSTAGLELHVQGILRDTCPGSCQSGVVSQVIQ